MDERTPAEQVAANARAEMARHGVSQTELAAALGIKQQSISRRLAGKTPITVDEAFAIANALGVPASQILPTEVRAA